MSAPAADPAKPLVFSAPVTHSDWMLRPGAEWGPAGVRKMLDTCKAAGLTRVYWRTLDGGRGMYRSKLVDPQGKWEEDSFWNPANEADRKLVETHFGSSPALRARLRPQLDALDYSTLDTLAEAVRYGHQIGLEVHAWVTINEDDHGWGIRSRFVKEHPDCRWRKRDGSVYRSQLSFAYPEVMTYKLALLDELLTNYEVDGLFLDWLRTGDVRDNPQTDADGVADHGYEPPQVNGFKAKFGADPKTLPNGDEHWVRHRAEPHTEFLRAARKLTTAKRPGAKLTVLVAHPWCYRGLQNKIAGNLRGLLLDVPVWAKEGLIDGAVAGGYYLPGGSAEAAYRALRDETGGAVPVWLYEWVPANPGEADRAAALARKVGAGQVLFWEADYLDDGRPKADISRALRAAVGR